MNFQQLRIIREAVRQNFNLTEVGNALFTSQSGVSKHIKDLEDELGLELFVRKGKRLLGLTSPGKEVLTLVERMLRDSHNIKKLADQFRSQDEGQLTVATTHTQARYVLPQVVARFKQEFPKVHLALHQGSPSEITQLLLDGVADIGVATEQLSITDELIAFPYYQWYHAVIVPQKHPLHLAFGQQSLAKAPKPKSKQTATTPPITLRDLTDYPIVTYHFGFTGRQALDEAFAEQGLQPDVVMSALDADVIKTYVELGLGIGIIASVAFDSLRDKDLALLPSQHLFPLKTTYLAVHKNHYLRGFAYRFMQLCSPQLSEAEIKQQIIQNTSAAL